MSTPHSGAGFGHLRLCVSAMAIAGVLSIAATASARDHPRRYGYRDRHRHRDRSVPG